MSKKYPEPTTPAIVIHGLPLSEWEIAAERGQNGEVTGLSIAGKRERRATLAQAFQDGEASAQEKIDHLNRMLIMERLRSQELRRLLAESRREAVTLHARNVRLKEVIRTWQLRYPKVSVVPRRQVCRASIVLPSKTP